MKKRFIKNDVPLIAGIILFICIPGSVITFFSILNILRGIDSASWNIAVGYIKSLEVKKGWNSDFGRYNDIYINVIYNVDGNRYEATRFYFGPTGYYTPGETEKMKAHFPIDSSINVYYNPENPGDSVISPGILWQNWLLLIIGFIIIAGGIFLTYMDCRDNKKTYYPV